MKQWTRHNTDETFATPVSPLGWSLLQQVMNKNLEFLNRYCGAKKLNSDDLAAQIDFYIYANRELNSLNQVLLFSPWTLVVMSWRFAVCCAELLFVAPMNPNFPVWQRIPVIGALAAIGLSWYQKRPRTGAYLYFKQRLFIRVFSPVVERFLKRWDNEKEASIEKLEKWLERQKTLSSDSSGFEEKPGQQPTLAGFDNYFSELEASCGPIVEKIFMTRLMLKINEVFLAEWLTLTLNQRNIREFISAPRTFPQFKEQMPWSWDMAQLPEVEIHGADKELLANAKLKELSFSNSTESGSPEANQAANQAARQEAFQACRGQTESDFLRLALNYLDSLNEVNFRLVTMSAYLMAPIRQKLICASENFVAKNVFKETEDIFYLSIKELRELFAPNARFAVRGIDNKITTRRLAFVRAAGFSMPIEISASDLKLQSVWGYARTSRVKPYLEVFKNGRILVEGTARGPARVVSKAADLLALQPGEIVVAQNPNLTIAACAKYIAGAVFENADTMSASIHVYRAYKIPVLGEMKGSVAQIKTGDIITFELTGSKIGFEVTTAVTAEPSKAIEAPAAAHSSSVEPSVEATGFIS